MDHLQPAEPLVRTFDLTASTSGDGSTHAHGRVEDFFHGFEVDLLLRKGVIVEASASSFKHPWTTCPGALQSVPRLAGSLAHDARAAVQRLGRSNTCVHINDLIALTATAHIDRRYRVECDDTHIRLERDTELLHDLPMDGWKIVGGPWDSYWVNDPRWAQVIGTDRDMAEIVLMLRRAQLVAMGIWLLDWSKVSRGHEIEYAVMADSCHTFSEPQLSQAVSLVDPPRMKDE